jgi:predicted nucleic acid-binding protein
VLFLDSTALVARHVGGPSHAVVVDACRTDGDWCASALARTEAVALIERVSALAGEQRELRRALAEDWDGVNIVPVDARCLDRAAALARDHPLRIVDAIHLAAADRLPRPVTYCTFDPNQIPVALALGFDVASI